MHAVAETESDATLRWTEDQRSVNEREEATARTSLLFPMNRGADSSPPVRIVKV